MLNSNKKGFTLIELLVVISIISFLSTIVLGVFQDAKEKAAIAQMKQTAGQIRNALEMYKNEHATYPPYNSISIYTSENKVSDPGTIKKYLSSINIEYKHIKSFSFDTSYVGSGDSAKAFYYYLNSNGSSCADISSGITPPYTFTFKITNPGIDLTKKFGFYKAVDGNGNLYSSVYCLFTPPY